MAFLQLLFPTWTRKPVEPHPGTKSPVARRLMIRRSALALIRDVEHASVVEPLRARGSGRYDRVAPLIEETDRGRRRVSRDRRGRDVGRSATRTIGATCRRLRDVRPGVNETAGSESSNAPLRADPRRDRPASRRHSGAALATRRRRCARLCNDGRLARRRTRRRGCVSARDA
jgi:hypothetical protein